MAAEPRELVAAVGQPIEMEKHGQRTFCCGAGGAHMWMEERGSQINEERVRQATETGASTLAVACPLLHGDARRRRALGRAPTSRWSTSRRCSCRPSSGAAKGAACPTPRRGGARQPTRPADNEPRAMHVRSSSRSLRARVFVVGAIAAAFADRVGAPALLLFLGLGILLGEDGPGGIKFDDYTLVRDVGTVALALILFEGGALAESKALRRVRTPALLLATLGVVVTAAVVAGAAYLTLDISTSDALLVGAVVSSTDAAAVFAATRGFNLRERLSSLLELESGLNDPVAALLVIFLVEQRTSDEGLLDAIVLFVQQAAIGVALGIAAGAAAVVLLRRLPLPSAGLAPVLATGIALAGYTASAALGGSGLLSAYLAGIIVGSAHVPHGPVIRGFLQGTAWVAQIGLFVLLGLLVTPSRLFESGSSPILIAAALVLVARPLADGPLPAAAALAAREVAFIAAAGLRGGVPIVFATFPVAAGLTGSVRMFDVVFFVVVASVALQGADAAPARAPSGRHRAATAVPRDEPRTPTPCAPPARSWSRCDATTLGIDGPTLVRDLALPSGAVIAAIRREGQVVLPRGTTPVEPDDVLYLLRERDPVRRPRADRRPPRRCPRRVDRLHAAPLRPRPRRRHASRRPRSAPTWCRTTVSWCTSRAPTRSPC